MNFLAHIYLSGNNPKIMVGNFIGDFVKGRNLLEQFEPGIAKGIELHRAIDEFTDNHPVVLQSKIRLRPKYRHFAAVIVDIYYDHFLACNWSEFHRDTLDHFTQRSYAQIQDEWEILPAGVKQMLPHMIRHNWLLHYGELEGVGRALGGMAQRSRFDSKMDESIAELREFYVEFEAEFALFFPELKAYAERFILEV
ncbi:MAG: ACP phosphodiesterase [Cyclobacteriaceae bacterium]|nr:ACP phosphodiesterase [Cyclobacteriaceae bacterium]MDH4296439.1 ACP phosphodiesterase [Cyclobacteriaceae bacterium]MDH5249138.1 ACP phosphodiesterase [Cyclobacteriaceae bacterium]